MNNCYYGSYNTRHYQGQNNVDFEADMRGVANPMKKTLSSWPVSVICKQVRNFIL